MRGRYRDYHTLPALTHVYLPIISVPHQSHTAITTDGPVSHRIISLSPYFTFEFTQCYAFCGSGEMYSHDMYSSLGYHFALKILFAHLFILPFPLIPDNHWSFHQLHSFNFPSMSQSWNHKYIALLYWLLLLSNMHLNFLCVFSWLYNSFLFSAK